MSFCVNVNGKPFALAPGMTTVLYCTRLLWSRAEIADDYEALWDLPYAEGMDVDDDVETIRAQARKMLDAIGGTGAVDDAVTNYLSRLAMLGDEINAPALPPELDWDDDVAVQNWLRQVTAEPR